MKKKIVLKLEEYDEEMTREAMKFVGHLDGIESVSMNPEKMELTVIVTGDDIGPMEIVTALRKHFLPAELLSVGPVKEPAMKKEDGKKDEIMDVEYESIPQIQPKSFSQNQAKLDLQKKIEEEKIAYSALHPKNSKKSFMSFSQIQAAVDMIKKIEEKTIANEALFPRSPYLKSSKISSESGVENAALYLEKMLEERIANLVLHPKSSEKSSESFSQLQAPLDLQKKIKEEKFAFKARPPKSSDLQAQLDLIKKIEEENIANKALHLKSSKKSSGSISHLQAAAAPHLEHLEKMFEEERIANMALHPKSFEKSSESFSQLQGQLDLKKKIEEEKFAFKALHPKSSEKSSESFMTNLSERITSLFTGFNRTDNRSSTNLIESSSEPISFPNLNPAGSSGLTVLPIKLNDSESSRPFHDPEPEVSIKSSSASSQNILEIRLKFHDIHGTVFDFLELLGLIENALGYEPPKSKLVAVMNLKVIHIRNSILPETPYNLSFPNVKMLILHTHLDSSNIPSFFERMPALKVLDISNTSIGTLPSWVYKFTKLEELIVQHCELLIGITQEIGELTNLKKFDLSGCKSLTKLPESICNLRSLRNMNLSGCTNLVEIPESIEFLEGLSSLDLTDCKSLRKLPESTCNMRSLKCLYLSGCSRLFEVQTGWNDPESPTQLHVPKLSINTLSTTRKSDTMEVLLDFHGTEGTLFDITELLFLMKLVLGYKLLKSKFVEVVNLKVIHIRNYRLSQIPDNLSFPNLEMLVLQPNIDFSYIPSLFVLMPALKVLDMSHTSIKTLPYWVYQLTKLEELILRYCELLIELPHEVSALKNLKVLDLEGTDLVCLPEELKELIELKCLKFSLYDAESYRKNKDIVAIIPRKTLSKLTQLEELSINVDPQEVWCGAAMEAVMEDLPSLRKLKLLKLYLPTTKLLQDLLELKRENGLPIYQNLSNFTFVIGPHAEHFISRLPCDLEEEFLKLKKCLKYINGENSTPKLAEALKHANALYLDRHWTLQKLSVFKFEDLIELKFCLLVDCNEMQTLFDGSDFNLGIVNNGDKLLSLQYLAIHYLRKLEVIWKGPGVGCCLHSLKVLVVHTCPNLTTIFTPVLLEYLVNLREIEVEDCPKIKTLVAEDQSYLKSKEIIPRLKKLSFLYLPELVSMFDGFSIGPELENIVIYDCPKLERLPSVGVCNKEVIEVKGESEWWNALEWNESEWSGGRPYCLRAFSESDTDEDLQDELAPRYGNTLRLLVEDCNST